MSPTPAAITGLGAVSPYGAGVGMLWQGLLTGRLTAGPITRYDHQHHRIHFACQVPDEVSRELPKKLLRMCDPFARFALLAAEEALVQAGLLRPDASAIHNPVIGVDPERVAVVIASGAGGITEITDQHARLLAQGPDRVRPYLSVAMPLNMAAGQVALRHGLRGPTSAVVSACASAADAIGRGLDILRAGRADVVVAGGAEAAVNPLLMAGFDAARAMSRRNDDPQRASRPFDHDRDGFVAGEGAGMLVLERPEHADARGAAPLGWLAGYGATNDAHDPTTPAPDGASAARAMRLAMADGMLTSSDIDHVNVHATSTSLGDLAECRALHLAFAGTPPPVTAPKSMIGHLMGAAGAVEAVATIMALLEREVPPTANLDHQDPACDVDVVTGVARPLERDAALSNAFGFGGHNAVLAFLTVDAGQPGAHRTQT